ncbi:EF-hand domain-containing protein [Xanthomonas maliensis]|uniref:EF-hand domain-containing protein n=1 Tax=Xanthomonas maliensis TaxID=1321368 RepID=UPI0003A7107C|nr:EF-hand domain-containing protein [Xanthomonas maliensis]KAB7768859.1 2-oxoglutarate dehydrogenase [Xanthomonas maliensis]
MHIPSAVRPLVPLLALLAGSAAAQSLPTQLTSTATTHRAGGLEGPFALRADQTAGAPVADSVGDSLQHQAQQRLTQALGAEAALAQGATLTRQQAQAQGLGFLATHFDQIDRSHSGRITLDDVQAYLQQSH